jgi:uncharacterized membrane protein YhaH (DUF805 family)
VFGIIAGIIVAAGATSTYKSSTDLSNYSFSYGSSGLALTNPSATSAAQHTGTGLLVFIIIWAIVGIVLMIPTIANDVRRLHDTNRTGALAALPYAAPIVGSFILAYLEVQESVAEGAKYDRAPMMAAPVNVAPVAA